MPCPCCVQMFSTGKIIQMRLVVSTYLTACLYGTHAQDGHGCPGGVSVLPKPSKFQCLFSVDRCHYVVTWRISVNLFQNILLSVSIKNTQPWMWTFVVAKHMYVQPQFKILGSKGIFGQCWNQMHGFARSYREIKEHVLYLRNEGKIICSHISFLYTQHCLPFSSYTFSASSQHHLQSQLEPNHNNTQQEHGHHPSLTDVESKVW